MPFSHGRLFLNHFLSFRRCFFNVKQNFVQVSYSQIPPCRWATTIAEQIQYQHTWKSFAHKCMLCYSDIQQTKWQIKSAVPWGVQLHLTRSALHAAYPENFDSHFASQTALCLGWGNRWVEFASRQGQEILLFFKMTRMALGLPGSLLNGYRPLGG